MNIFDIVVGIIMLIIIIRAWFKGFSGMILSAASFVISAILAWLLHPAVASLLEGTGFPYAVRCGIAVVIIFILSMIICAVVSFFVKGIFKLPVLKSADKLVGVLIGLVCAIVFAKIAASAFALVYNGLSLINFEHSLSAFENSLIVKIFN